MQHISFKDYDPRAATGPPSEYSLRNTYWEQIIYSRNIYCAVYYQSASSILNNLCKASLYSVYYYNYCLLVRSCNMSHNYTHWEPCKYLYPIAYMKKVYCTYYLLNIAGADFKSYLEIICGCPPQASYWRTMPFITCEPCNCIHIETYWRKVIPLFTYIYNSMLYVSECRNIFKILINTVNRTILSNLTTSIHV